MMCYSKGRRRRKYIYYIVLKVSQSKRLIAFGEIEIPLFLRYISYLYKTQSPYLQEGIPQRAIRFCPRRAVKTFESTLMFGSGVAI